MVQNKNNIKSKKGQIFSADIIIVVVILLFGVLFLVAHKMSMGSTKVNNLNNQVSVESKVIFENLKSNKIISKNNEVNLESLKQLDVNKLREDLSIKGHFCIVFEKDGKLIHIDPKNQINGIGDKDIIVNGKPCYTVTG